MTENDIGKIITDEYGNSEVITQIINIRNTPEQEVLSKQIFLHELFRDFERFLLIRNDYKVSTFCISNPSYPLNQSMSFHVLSNKKLICFSFHYEENQMTTLKEESNYHPNILIFNSYKYDKLIQIYSNHKHNSSNCSFIEKDYIIENSEYILHPIIDFDIPVENDKEIEIFIKNQNNTINSKLNAKNISSDIYDYKLTSLQKENKFLKEENDALKKVLESYIKNN